MKRLIFIITIFTAVVTSLTTSSCYPDKDIDEVIKTDSTYVSFQDTVWQDLTKFDSLPSNVKIPIEKLDSLLKTLPKINNIDGEQGGTIKLDDEVEIVFPGNSCSGDGLTNNTAKGKIDIHLSVLKTKGELVLQNINTISGGKLLVSGGVFIITATQNGRELRLVEKKLIKLRYKTSTPDARMLMFEGKNTARFSGIDWNQMLSGYSSVSLWLDSLKIEKGLEVTIDRLGLTSISKPYDGNEKLITNFCATLSDNTFSNFNTSVFVVFKDMFSVVRLEGNVGKKVFCLPSNYKGLPVGKSVYVVALSQLNGKSYMAISESSVTEGGVVKLQPQSYELSEIKLKLKNL